MLIAEQLLLLSRDAASGRQFLRGRRLRPALGGALVTELALRERIGVTPYASEPDRRYRVHVVSTAPTDDPELDRVLEHLVVNEDEKLAVLLGERSKVRFTQDVDQRLTQRLVDAGVLGPERKGSFGRRTQDTLDPVPGREIRQRLQRALAGGGGGEEPSEETVALIGIVDAVWLVPKVITFPKDRAAVAAVGQRIDQLTGGDPVRVAVRNAAVEASASVLSRIGGSSIGGSWG